MSDVPQTCTRASCSTAEAIQQGQYSMQIVRCQGCASLHVFVVPYITCTCVVVEIANQRQQARSLQHRKSYRFLSAQLFMLDWYVDVVGYCWVALCCAVWHAFAMLA
jgi:hypothetical protein